MVYDRVKTQATTHHDGLSFHQISVMSWKIPSKNDDYILFLWFPTGCSVSFRQFAGSYLVYVWLAQEIGIYETDLNQPVAN